MSTVRHSAVRHRDWLRLTLWLATVALAFTLSILYITMSRRQRWDAPPSELLAGGFTWGRDRESVQLAESVWLKLCDPRDERENLGRVLVVAAVVLLLNVVRWLYMFTASLVPTRLRQRARANGGVFGWWQRWRYPAKLVDGSICLVLMWVLLVEFHIYRDQVSNIAGNSDEDGAWTFGQVLALGTWAPVLIDLFSVYMCKWRASMFLVYHTSTAYSCW